MSFAQADATSLPLADDSVSLTFCSPPYLDARTYGISAQRGCVAWVEWMLKVVTEAQRVTRGPVIVVAAGVTRQRNYWPGCEGLMWEWWKRGGDCQLYRPCFWNRVGIPGSGGKDWFRADVEYVMCFKRPGPLPWSDNTACGHPPKWGPGGEMSHRTSKGTRVNQWGHPIDSGGSTGGIDDVTCGPARPSHQLIDNRSDASKILVPYGGAVSNATKDGRKRNAKTGGRAAFGGGGTSFGRRANGQKIPPASGNGFRVNERRANGMRVASGTGPSGEQLPNRETAFPVLANPGNLVKVIVGGGVMGPKCCHENEAPFPEKLAEFFIKSLCPPGGIVLDQFSGSGTTVAVARRLGRRGIGFDLRMSQCLLGRRRLLEDAERVANPQRKPARRAVIAGEPTLFEMGAA